MDVNEYIKIQENEYVNAFNDPAHFPIGISTINRFPDYFNFDQEFSFIHNIKNNNAFIRKTHSGTQFEFWVRVKYTGYRKSFLNFLENYYNLERNEIDSTWHVDHVLNRAFANKAGMNYVRLCLLKNKQNLSYGSKFEKAFKNIYTSKKDIFIINFISAMKVLNVICPKSQDEYNQRKEEICKTMENKGVEFIMNESFNDFDMFFNMWNIL